MHAVTTRNFMTCYSRCAHSSRETLCFEKRYCKHVVIFDRLFVIIFVYKRRFYFKKTDDKVSVSDRETSLDLSRRIV
jgi:hypothetical protein